jgi:hypothetical protein
MGFLRRLASASRKGGAFSRVEEAEGLVLVLSNAQKSMSYVEADKSFRVPAT